jgi:class 3 adenylate cyclase
VTDRRVPVRREASPEDEASFGEVERQLLLGRWGYVAPALMIGAVISEILPYLSPEFPKAKLVSGAMIVVLGALWLWARHGASRRVAAAIWILAGWLGAAYIATACVDSGRFRSLHVLGVATIVALTPTGLSFTFRESLASLGGALLTWTLVCLFYKAPAGGIDSGGLATSLMYLTFISAAAVAALTWSRQLRLREWVARRQVEEMHRFAVEEVLLRHLPPDYVEDVLAGHRKLDAPPERRTVTVVFADIVSFTPLSDTLPPEQLAAAMARFYDVTSTVAFEHGATIDKFIGDSVMAFLGAPAAMEEDEQVRRAFAVALAWHARVGALAPAGAPLALRIGIHQDVVAVGTFGGKRRTDFTVLGHGVNLAARLEQACSPGRILVSEQVWSRMREPRPAAESRDLQLKGIPGTVRAFSVEV